LLYTSYDFIKQGPFDKSIADQLSVVVYYLTNSRGV
jgi:hypothetical protein